MTVLTEDWRVRRTKLKLAKAKLQSLGQILAVHGAQELGSLALRLAQDQLGRWTGLIGPATDCHMTIQFQRDRMVLLGLTW